MSNKPTISEEVVINKIYLANNIKVMLDSDLAKLYRVETKRLNEQVKRNSKRFPEDFMFQLSKEQWENLKSQNATSSWGGRRTLPYAFTEQGVAMLSSILNSDVAIDVNIQIIRVFTKMRALLLNNNELLIKVNELEAKVSNQDKSIRQVFDYLKQFVQQQEEPRKAIGYKSS